MTMNSMDMMNMAEPANVASLFSTPIPLPDRYMANRKMTRHRICITEVSMLLALFVLEQAQLAAITVELGFWEI